VVDVARLREGERAGLVVFGADYAWIGVERREGPLSLVMRVLENAGQGRTEREVGRITAPPGPMRLRVSIGPGGVCRFSAGDRQTMTSLGVPFTAKPGRWVGAKVGLFAAAPAGAKELGYATVRSFVVSR